MKSWRYAIYLLAPLTAGCGPVAATTVAPSTAEAPASQSAEPALARNLVLRDIHGQEHTLFGDMVTKAIVCVFLLRDCPIANSYIPELRRMHESFANRGVDFYLVQVAPDLSLEEARTHAREFALPGVVVLDRKHEIVARAGATKVPQGAVFASNGELRYCGRIDDLYAGYGKRRAASQRHDLRDAIEAVLAGRAAAEPTGETIGCDIPTLEQGSDAS